MSVASGVPYAIRPGEDDFWFQQVLQMWRKSGAFVFSVPRLGEELIVFASIANRYLASDPSMRELSVPYNLGRVVSCKFFDGSGRKFVVETNRMFRRVGDRTDRMVIVEETGHPKFWMPDPGDWPGLETEETETLLVELAEGVASPRT